MQLTELAQRLDNLKRAKKDYLVRPQQMQMTDDAELKISGQHYKLNNWSSGQLASYTEIPKQYFERLRTESPHLLAKNVNHGLEKIANGKEESIRMIRCDQTDNHVRAVVSNSFGRYDLDDLAQTVMPILLDQQFEPHGCDLTEQKLYIKAVTPKVEAEIGVGDVVQYGVIIQASDVGAGAIKIEPFFNRLVCLNGMIMPVQIKKVNRGSRQYLSDFGEQILSSSTQQAKSIAFFKEVADILRHTMRPETFEREVNKMRQASKDKITNYDLEEVVELASETLGIFNKDIKQEILGNLANGAHGAGLTRWGLANAITFAAHSDKINYDVAVDLEKAGGKIIDMKANEWTRIATVAQ